MRHEDDDPGVGAEPAPRLFEVRRRPGDLFFAGILFLIALFLLSRLPAEIRWFERVDLPLQPRFWPAIVLSAFTLFSGLYLLQGWLARNGTVPRPSAAQPEAPAIPCNGIAKRPQQRSPPPVFTAAGRCSCRP